MEKVPDLWIESLQCTCTSPQLIVYCLLSLFSKAICSCCPVVQSWYGKKFGGKAFGRTID